MPGVARRLVTFFCFAKRKVTKEKATQVRRPFGLPCAARRRRRLRNSRLVDGLAQKAQFVLAAQTVLADYPFVRSAARRLSWGPPSAHYRRRSGEQEKPVPKEKVTQSRE